MTVFPVDDDEPMADYIRKDTARRIIDSPRNREQMIAMLEAVPSEDVQPVIRCKDCKWFNKIGCAIKIVDESDKPHEDDFCSFAERRTDESD